MRLIVIFPDFQYNLGQPVIDQLKKDLQKLANPQKAKVFARFFKTGKGEYGEGDRFLGIMTEPLRQLAQKYVTQLGLSDLQSLLNGKYHEERSLALSILKRQCQKADEKGKKKIVDFYLKNTKRINNWDLVDISAPDIVGEYLRKMGNGEWKMENGKRMTEKRGREILYKLAKSKNLWERRIAIMSTFAFVKNNDFDDTLKISEILLNDKHDLIHKAVGWMLREIGKRNQKVEEDFLKKHCRKMPRTMLRYAIEKFPESKRQYYLH